MPAVLPLAIVALLAYIVLAGVFLWFFIFYPDKSFLPEQFRAWLGH